MINELGPNDRYVKALLKAFDSGHAKKVAAVVCRNPNASREEVELELSTSDYDEVVSFVDKLRIQESNEVSTEVKRMQEIAGIKGLPDHEQDDYEGNIVDDFTTGDWVKSKSANVGGQVVGTNWRENSVTVKLPNGKLQKFDANDLIQDPYEDDEEDHEGTWADFKGDEKFFNESDDHVELDEFFSREEKKNEERTLESFLQEDEDDFDLSVNPLSVDKTKSSAESYVKTLMPQIRDLVESVFYYTAQDLEEEGECEDSESCERLAALEMSDLIEMRAIESLDDLVADELSADDGEDPLFIEVLELCTDYVSIVVQELADDYM